MTKGKHLFCGPTGSALCGASVVRRLHFTRDLVTCDQCLRLDSPEAKTGREHPAPICPYCGRLAEFAYGVDVHPSRPDLAAKAFWVCWADGARVGCHPSTTEPLGTLANAPLRRLRSEVHQVLDRRWLEAHPRNRQARRGETYAWLAKRLGIPETECHVGMFDEARCKAALKALETKTP